MLPTCPTACPTCLPYLPALQENLLCLPLDRRLPLIRVRTRQAAHLLGQRLVLRLDTWEADQRFPSGHVARVGSWAEGGGAELPLEPCCRGGGHT